MRLFFLIAIFSVHSIDASNIPNVDETTRLEEGKGKQHKNDTCSGKSLLALSLKENR